MRFMYFEIKKSRLTPGQQQLYMIRRDQKSDWISFFSVMTPSLESPTTLKMTKDND